MSLKNWKESLKSCTSGEGRGAYRSCSLLHGGEGWKPRKTSLKGQIAALGRLAVDSQCISSEELCQSGVSATPPPTGSEGCGEEEEGDVQVKVRRIVGEDVSDFVENVDFSPDDGDSEVGLFMRSEPSGPFEPLVLRPVSKSDGNAKVVQVPASINSRLLEHQREGVKFLYSLYREGRGGILGDDMGLGKTIQSIAFLAAVLDKQEGLDRGKTDSSVCQKVVLIICPTSVIQNWSKEFEAWGAFQVGIYHGIQRECVLAKLEAMSLEVLLTSHDTFRLSGTELEGVEWDCVIVDEAHRLKNAKSRLYEACLRVRTRRRYGLTGTIMQNKFLEMFNVFEWAAPGCLGARDQFLEYYDKPLKEGQRISAPDRFVRIAEERKKKLVDVLQKYFLRRTKEETIGHLMMGKEDNVIFCAMSSVQRRVYQRILGSPDFLCLVRKDSPCSCGGPLASARCCHSKVPDGPIWTYLHREDKEGCDKCPYCLILPCLTKLQQASNHLELIKPNPKDDPEKQKKDKDFAALALGEDALAVGGVCQEENFLGLSDAQHCGKMRALEKLLALWVSAADKVLLFSYSVKMLDILEKFVIRKGYCFSRLDGSSPMGTRQSMVDDFNTKPSKQIFLISTRAGGLGLNLVSANRIVIFDPNWNPAIDLQAQDRSFRYGQRRHVTVFRLLAAGSLEELVYTRQIYKQQLFNIAVTGVDEKRYFEGVQDTKNTGELFGIGNLLKDLSDEVFTSNIIESEELKLEIKSDFAMKEIASNKKHLKGLRRQAQSVDHSDQDEHGLGALAQLIQAGAKAAEAKKLAKQNNTSENRHRNAGEEVEQARDAVGQRARKARGKYRLPQALSDAGVVYTHRNEEVVNLGVRIKQASSDFPDDSTSNQVELFSDAALSPKVSVPASKRHRANKENTSLNVDSRTEKTASICVSATSVDPSHEIKSAQFCELANFHGLSITEFSKWMRSCTEEERVRVLADFQNS